MSDYEDNDYGDNDEYTYDNPEDDEEEEPDEDELNGEEEETMTSPILDATKDKRVKKEDRQPFPNMSKEECTGILGKRTAQLDAGSPSPLEGRFSTIDPYEIAVIELFTRTLPIDIEREFPDGRIEYWTIAELEPPFGFIRIPPGIKDDLKRLIEELRVTPLIIPEVLPARAPTPVTTKIVAPIVPKSPKAEPQLPGAVKPPVIVTIAGGINTLNIPKPITPPVIPKNPSIIPTVFTADRDPIVVPKTTGITPQPMIPVTGGQTLTTLNRQPTIQPGRIVAIQHPPTVIQQPQTRPLSPTPHPPTVIQQPPTRPLSPTPHPPTVIQQPPTRPLSPPTIQQPLIVASGAATMTTRQPVTVNVGTITPGPIGRPPVLPGIKAPTVIVRQPVTIAPGVTVPINRPPVIANPAAKPFIVPTGPPIISRK
jgi:DNA-directed RNA polymerase subunit K/omega